MKLWFSFCFPKRYLGRGLSSEGDPLTALCHRRASHPWTSVPCLRLVVRWLLVNTDSYSWGPLHSSAGFGSRVVVSPYGSCEDPQGENYLFSSSLWQGEWIVAIITWLLECIASHLPANVYFLQTYSSFKCPLLLSSLLQRHAGYVNIHMKAKGHSMTCSAGLGVKLLVAHVIRWDLWWNPQWPKDWCKLLHLLDWVVEVSLGSCQIYVPKKKKSLS